MTGREHHTSQRVFNLRVLALYGLHIAVLSLFAIYRFVDWDEGFYLQAGRSISDGLQLYSDFFYPQAPLYPHLLTLLPGSGWEYWLQARFVSVFLSLLTMALVALSVKRILAFTYDTKAPDYTARYRFAIIVALMLYSLSGLFLAWNSLAKPLALSQFLLVAGVFARLNAHNQKTASRAFWVLVSGVSLALASQTRSPMLVAWVVTLLSVFVGRNWKHRASNAILFLIGSTVASTPSINMALRDSSRFYFNNLGFHLSRTETPGLVDIFWDKLNFVTRTTLDPQFAIVLFSSLLILIISRKNKSEKTPLGIINYYPLVAGIAIIGSYFMAYPSHRQYVVQGLPVLIIFVAAHGCSLTTWLNNSKPLVLKKVLTSVAVIYALGMTPYFWIYFTASRERDQRCEKTRVADMVSIIETNSSPNDTILAESAIFAVLSNRKQARRAEFVGFEYKSLALGEGYGEMNLADSSYISELVTGQKVKLVVVENTPDPGLAKALHGNYQKIYDDGFSQVWDVALVDK